MFGFVHHPERPILNAFRNALTKRPQLPHSDVEHVQKIGIALAGLAFVLATAILLSRQGAYGYTLFVLLPVIAGALAAWACRPADALGAIGLGVNVGVIGCLLFLLLGREGFICVLMALPVVTPLAAIGSLMAYWGGASSKRSGTAAMCLLRPLSLLFDVNARPPVYSVATIAIVNAPPARVWKYVVAFPDIADPVDPILRAGFAYPVRTRIDGAGVGAPRSCDLSTGTVRERVTVWDEPHLLRFTVTATPPAMKEMGLYGPIYPKHLDGYYVSKAGQFELTPLSGGRTLITGTSWYQHGLWPAQYWRLWSDMVVHHIHRRVLEHIRELAEG